MGAGSGSATPRLRVRLAQASERGQHARNQDFHGACVPNEEMVPTKGVVLAIADGVGSSEVAHLASEIAVRSMLEDFFSTPASWSIRKSAQRVIEATNGWLYAQSRQAGHTGARRDQACACTLSVLVLHSCTAHVFHVGDARIYRLRQGELEQITQDHRVFIDGQTGVSRVLGVAQHVEVDYESQPIEIGDVFALMTDGVHEHVDAAALRYAMAQAASPDADLAAVAAGLVASARSHGSTDDATIQILHVLDLPERNLSDLRQYAGPLPCPPLLSPGQSLDGLTVIEQLHASSRSHVYDRVHLSSFFAGTTAEELSLVEPGFYDRPSLSLRLNARVQQIDRRIHQLTLADGETMSYDRLVLATGSVPFVPAVQGRDRDGCFVYRTIEDLEGMLAAGRDAQSGVVIGGGLLGLECAKALRDMKLTTHVVEFSKRLMAAQVQHVVDNYRCEWKEAVSDPDTRKRFKTFVNSDAADANIQFVPERAQIRPATEAEKTLAGAAL